jgi:hypothetical protein
MHPVEKSATLGNLRTPFQLVHSTNFALWREVEIGIGLYPE